MVLTARPDEVTWMAHTHNACQVRDSDFEASTPDHRAAQTEDVYIQNQITLMAPEPKAYTHTA